MESGWWQPKPEDRDDEWNMNYRKSTRHYISSGRMSLCSRVLYMGFGKDLEQSGTTDNHIENCLDCRKMKKKMDLESGKSKPPSITKGKSKK